MPQISKGLKQAYELQDFAFDAAMSLKHSLTKEDGNLVIAREDAQSIAALVKSWESCQQRIQVHRRVPNPGSIRRAVEKPTPSRRKWRSSDPQPTPISQSPTPIQSIACSATAAPENTELVRINSELADIERRKTPDGLASMEDAVRRSELLKRRRALTPAR